MKDFNKTLDKYGTKIENEINKFFKKKISESTKYNEFIVKVYNELKKYVLRRGKRLASCSTLLVYKGYKGKIDKKILDVCVGIELYRHSILIHDDLIDMDDLRRGGLAFHKIFEDVSDRFGNGTAVFSGNILYSLSLELILNSEFDINLKNGVISLINSDYCNVNESQILDLLFEFKEPDVDEWYQMASKRAASLFRATMLSGAILAEVSEDEIELLKEIATNIGYSFDIQDDIIGTFSTDEEYGRPTIGDIVLGKKPLHIIYALKNAPDMKSRILKEILKNKNPAEDDIEIAKMIIRKYGLENARDKSKKHAENAIKLIHKTRMNNETKDFFINFINYITESLDWYKSNNPAI